MSNAEEEDSSPLNTELEEEVVGGFGLRLNEPSLVFLLSVALLPILRRGDDTYAYARGTSTFVALMSGPWS